MRDPYTDGLLRRIGPPETYQTALERVRRRDPRLVARMPTRHELAARRAVARRQAARAAAEIALLSLLLALIVLLIANR